MQANRFICTVVTAAVVGFAGITQPALGQAGTAFTYQGLLENAGARVTGSADIRFSLFAAASGGSPLFSPITSSNVTVSDGLFTSSVDFGVNPYTGDNQLWLQIEVRSPAGVGGFTLLGSRQRLTPAPFALNSRGLDVTATNDVFLRSNFGGTRTFGLPQGNALSTNLVIQAGGTLISNGNAQNGGTLTLRAGNANLSASSAPATGTSGGNDVVIQAGENTANFSFFDRFSGNIRFIAGDSGTTTGNQPERMRILGDNGFIGIGTTSPTSLLDVRGSTAAITVGAGDGTAGGLFLGNPAHGLRRNYSGVNDVGLFTTSGNLRFSAGGNAATQMILTTAGRLGIGTLNPSDSLDVGGRAVISASGNGRDDAQIRLLRSDTGALASLISGYTGPTSGYQIALVNAANTALIGSLFSNYATNQSGLTANIKNFVEPNPSDPSTDIYYACLEGPEAAMYTRGTGQLVQGRAVITLPSHFSDLASSSGLTVIVTPQSADSLGLAVVGKAVTGFEVRELHRGTGTYAFDWEVKAVRKQYLNYQVVRPWTERRIVNPNVSETQAWRARQLQVAESNARAQAQEAAAIGAQR